MGRPHHRRGMVTAELAVALPALVMVVSLLITIVGAASDASRASEAAERCGTIGVPRHRATTSSSVRPETWLRSTPMFGYGLTVRGCASRSQPPGGAGVRCCFPVRPLRLPP